MAIKRPKPKNIIMKLRQVEVLMAQVMTRIDAIRQISVAVQTYFHWNKNYSGMGTENLKELRILEEENECPKWAVYHLTLDKLI